MRARFVFFGLSSLVRRDHVFDLVSGRFGILRDRDFRGGFRAIIVCPVTMTAFMKW